ncbi:DUF2974 domain-containing protein [Pontibacter ruber]|uniref:DUF2974 domain-containing protein n=1 Tax=Pontibacter ruber TaxID=1343895 RepID=A0ABW5CVB7_9BACT|nr:DUF2974 domain-containing protein [Pontibacter ruber]
MLKGIARLYPQAFILPGYRTILSKSIIKSYPQSPIAGTLVYHGIR